MINLKYTMLCYIYVRRAMQQTPKLLLSNTYTATLCRNLDIDEIGFLWFYFMLFMSHKKYFSWNSCFFCLAWFDAICSIWAKTKLHSNSEWDNEEIAPHDESIVYTDIQIMMMMMWVSLIQCKSFSKCNARQENLVPLKK